MTNANECTCPSGDGSLAHPCPAHPAVEQAGGDERAAFFKHLIGRHPANETEIVRVLEHNYSAWKAWQARAALAQPSPTIATAPTYQFHSREIGESDWAPCDFSWYLYCSKSPEMDTRVVEVTAQPSPKSGYYSDQEWINAGCPPEQPSPVQAEQAEAERPELWAVHAQGSDELYAAFTREDAEKHAAELNALPMPEGIAVGAVVVPSPWPEAEHWKYLAEQERDHKNEIAVRLRQFERICEGLPQDAIDGGWTVQGIRGYAKRLEDQLKAAQAQHSVPEGYALIPTRETEAMHDAVMALLYKGVARTDTQKLLDAYIAAAPGKEGA